MVDTPITGRRGKGRGPAHRAVLTPESTVEAELRRLNWALEAHVRSTSALRRDEGLEDLAQRVCAAIVGNDVYVLAAVGLADESSGRPIRIVAGAGRGIGYLEGLDLSWSEDRSEGQGPTGRAIRDGHPIIMRDSWRDPAYATWRARGDTFGIRSSVTAPFKSDGRVVGALLVYAQEPDAFGPRELSVFESLGQELAVSIELTEARERRQAADLARRAAEDALRDAQAELTRIARVSALGEFAATVAHEINQPLAAIVTNNDAALRWLARGPEHHDEALAAISRTARDARRASDVVQRIRTVVTNQPPQHVQLDLNETIRDIVMLTEGELRRSGVTVAQDLADDLAAVFGDRVQLQQVMVNLIMNGADAMRGLSDPSRRLTVRSRALADGAVEVEVEDQGVGLDPAASGRLFEHFFTTKEGGTGLGLAIARSIIEGHGGRIWARAAPRQGAIFAFRLPASAGDRSPVSG